MVEQYSNAVVNVSSVTKAPRNAALPFQGQGPYGELPEEAQEFFRHFFGAPPQGGPMQKRASTGSGFIISSDGHVLTNNHVIDGADEITVRLRDRREIEAKVVGTDPGTDLALLKIDGKDLPVVKLGNSDRLKVGEWVLAIGSPFGFDYSVSAGIISALNRSLPNEQNQNYVPFIQTDVAINPGNSGGPLFNLDGEVVGVNSQIYSRTGGFMGLSFAIPIDVAMDVADQLKRTGRVTRGWLGVLIQDVTRDLAETFRMPQPMGALVAQVVPNGPAATSGLQPGDVILDFNGTPIHESSALPPMVGVHPVGQPAKVTILRRGETRVMELMIGELPEDTEVTDKGDAQERPNKPNRIGLIVEDLSDEDRDQLGVGKSGVFVAKVEKGPAERAGIRVGDILLMVDNKEVESVSKLRELLDTIEPGRSVAALIQRNEGRIFVAVRLPKD
ncbi:MAG TPA: DegQ family serine endoprotease [Pseudomonadales bacterium]|nr:DegQ family serine endoprotease [Pseudomonadales bacterium]